MKKSVIFVVLYVLLSFITLATSVSAVAYSADSGITFSKDYVYKSSSIPPAIPLTFEATIYFPADTPETTRGGIIFGSYHSAKEACINFEIYTNGNPKLYIIDSSGTVYNILFDQINVYTGEWTNVAVALDVGKGTASCYINGILAQTITSNIPTAKFAPENAFCLGGDHRAGNVQFFTGILKNFSYYSDTRTSDEILSDFTNTSIYKNDLIGSYDFSSYKINTVYEKIKCDQNKGHSFEYHSNWLKENNKLRDYSYSFALIGDTQIVTRVYPDKLTYIYDWLVANQKSKKIKFVFGLGDITDTDTDEEWSLAKSQIKKLDSIVPYSLVRGNHDGIEQYNKYISYEDFSSGLSGSYDNTMMNTYQKLTVGNIKYLIINLDLSASDEVLDWANKLITDNRDHNVIITTHIYLLYNSTYIKSYDFGVLNNGEDLWKKLVSKHENVVLVICGHSSSHSIVVTDSTGIKGNNVVQILVDPQATDKIWGATGMISMMYFSEDGSEVQMECYSTVRNEYFLSENMFDLKLNVISSEKTDQTKNNSITDNNVTPEPTESPDNTIIPVISASIVALLVVVATVFVIFKKKQSTK